MSIYETIKAKISELKDVCKEKKAYAYSLLREVDELEREVDNLRIKPSFTNGPPSIVIGDKSTTLLDLSMEDIKIIVANKECYNLALVRDTLSDHAPEKLRFLKTCIEYMSAVNDFK